MKNRNKGWIIPGGASFPFLQSPQPREYFTKHVHDKERCLQNSPQLVSNGRNREGFCKWCTLRFWLHKFKFLQCCKSYIPNTYLLYRNHPPNISNPDFVKSAHSTNILGLEKFNILVWECIFQHSSTFFFFPAVTIDLIPSKLTDCSFWLKTAFWANKTFATSDGEIFWAPCQYFPTFWLFHS